ncbi:DUF5018 domain-containing protein [Sphingobacterium suaedae]|uniref:DUF5018 domain-containing protein n=1 Tax=Sphingobacterium suaedae TaxID=1686402 RepID=A0ABW5KKZ6_9SPHI
MKRQLTQYIHTLTGLGLVCLFFAACKKPDFVEHNDKALISDFYGTIDGKGRERLFTSQTSKDTIYLNVDYYYPVESDNEVDLKKLLLRASVPADAKITPSLDGFMDVSSPLPITVTAGTGEAKSYVVVARKRGNTDIKTIKLSYRDEEDQVNEVEGIINGNNVIFYILPGIDLSQATLTYQINRHATASIVNGARVDMNALKVPFTITSAGDAQRTFSLEVREPVKLDYGIGIDRRLFVKTDTELAFENHMQTSLFVSGDYLVIVSRTNPSVFRAYNRFTGTFSHTIANPFGSRLVFQGVDDGSGQFLLGTYTPSGSNFVVYRYHDVFDTNPTKIIDYGYTKPTTIAAADGHMGRRLNFSGDLSGKGVLIASISSSRFFLRWKIEGGQVVNNTPELVEYSSGNASLGFIPEYVPVSTDHGANYFASTISELAYISGASNTRIVPFEPTEGVILPGSIAYQRFNQADYLAHVRFFWSYNMDRAQLVLFDVTNKSNVSLPVSSPNYGQLRMYESEHFFGKANGNSGNDVCMATSENGDRLQVYMLLTNGGVLAHEFTRYASN